MDPSVIETLLDKPEIKFLTDKIKAQFEKTAKKNKDKKQRTWFSNQLLTFTLLWPTDDVVLSQLYVPTDDVVLSQLYVSTDDVVLRQLYVSTDDVVLRQLYVSTDDVVLSQLYVSDFVYDLFFENDGSIL